MGEQERIRAAELPIDVRVGFSPSTADVLSLYYFDFPLNRMPRFALRSLVSSWLARSDVAYADAYGKDGTFAGFVFGHWVGSRPWRKLLRRPVWVAAYASGLLARRLLNRVLTFWRAKNPERRSDALRKRLSAQPYLMVEFIYVQPAARGQDVAGRLLKAMETIARERGLKEMRANIAAGNRASMQAFAKAGWRMIPYSPTAFCARKDVASAPRP